MKFLVDECTGPAVAAWLADHGHDVVSAFDTLRGMSDIDLLRRALGDDRVLITNDRDFGERVFRDKTQHAGIIYLRVADQRAASKIDAVATLIEEHGESLKGRFAVVTERKVRFAD